MLPTQMTIPPTQNIGLLNESQPQVYSILANPNSPPSEKQHRRKKTSKLDDTIPVVVNPQITRTPMGVTFIASHPPSTIMPESIPSFAFPHPRTSNTFPYRVYLKSDLHDANNNINHNQSPPFSVSLNSPISTQTQQNPKWSSESLPPITVNSISQTSPQQQLSELNRLISNNERTTPVPSTQKTEYDNLIRSLIFTNQGSLFTHSHSFPLPPASMTPLQKPKRKYSKRTHPPALGTQHQASQCPMTFTQATVSNYLPSLSTATARSEEHNLPVDMTTASNFVPLTPPGSISSVKSPPIITNNESTLIPIQQQQHIIPQTKAELNRISRQYFQDQAFNFAQNSMNESSTNNFHRLLTTGHLPYYMIPSNLISTNIIPSPCSSVLSGTASTIPSMSTISGGVKKERKKRGEDGGRKSKLKIAQATLIEVPTNERKMAYKSSKTEISIARRQKQKDLHTKDIRTKAQLRRITRRNRLAVLKFMIRKRKQEQHERISYAKLSEIKAEEVITPLVSAHIAKVEKMQTSVADIITPSLKISFDGAQKIESISLYYHRRRRPDLINDNSLKALNNADNKLSLLIEAVEFIETLHGSSKLALGSVK